MDGQDIEVSEDLIMDIPENQEGLLEVQMIMSLGTDYKSAPEVDTNECCDDNDNDNEGDDDDVSEGHMFAITATCKQLLGDIINEIKSNDADMDPDESSESFDSFIEELASRNPEVDLYDYEQYKRFWRDTNHEEMSEDDYARYGAVMRNEGGANSL